MRIILSFILLLIFLFEMAGKQGIPVLFVENPKHDFGQIKEKNGPVSCTISFKNNGNSTLQILSVKSSCECTTPLFDYRPVLSGKSGQINISFNPENKNGAFEQKLMIVSNAVNEHVFLTIKGFVVSKEEPIEKRFHSTLGTLLSERNHLAYGDVYFPNKVYDTLRVFNPSKKKLQIEFFDLPEHISVKVQPEFLKPHDVGIIIVGYDAQKKNDWGRLIDKINFQVNKDKKEDYRISISANIKQDFIGWKLGDARPTISLVDTVFYFGVLPQQGEVIHQFKFTNTGKKDLFIRKVSTSCGCTISHVDNESAIVPGESSFIEAKFKAGSTLGGTSKTIHIITNDPLQEHLKLLIRGDIVPKH